MTNIAVTNNCTATICWKYFIKQEKTDWLNKAQVTIIVLSPPHRIFFLMRTWPGLSSRLIRKLSAAIKVAKRNQRDCPLYSSLQLHLLTPHSSYS